MCPEECFAEISLAAVEGFWEKRDGGTPTGGALGGERMSV
jgi:hypothetical protein